MVPFAFRKTCRSLLFCCSAAKRTGSCFSFSRRFLRCLSAAVNANVHTGVPTSRTNPIGSLLLTPIAAQVGSKIKGKQSFFCRVYCLSRQSMPLFIPMSRATGRTKPIGLLQISISYSLGLFWQHMSFSSLSLPAAKRTGSSLISLVVSLSFSGSSCHCSYRCPYKQDKTHRSTAAISYSLGLLVFCNYLRGGATRILVTFCKMCFDLLTPPFFFS